MPTLLEIYQLEIVFFAINPKNDITAIMPKTYLVIMHIGQA
jgi:hypothetical protein